MKKKKDTYVDPRSIVLKSPEPSTVWAGMERRGVVLAVEKKQVEFQAIFDSKLDVKTIPISEFVEHYTHTPKVSVGYLMEIHKLYAESAGATALARASLSAFFNTGQESTDMATKKSPKPVAKKATPAETKAAPAKATKKSAPVPTEKTGPGRKSAFGDSMKITLIAKENPKRAKAAERFALYKTGMTIGDYIAAGGTMADVRWDVKQNFISVK